MAGMGKQFQEDMGELVEIFKTEIQKAFAEWIFVRSRKGV